MLLHMAKCIRQMVLLYGTALMMMWVTILILFLIIHISTASENTTPYLVPCMQKGLCRGGFLTKPTSLPISSITAILMEHQQKIFAFQYAREQRQDKTALHSTGNGITC